MKKLITAALTFGTFFGLSVPVFADVPISISPPVNLKILDFGKVISAGVGIILIVSGLAAFIYLIWGGFEWIISGGDKSKVESAQHRIQAALLGLFIVFASWAIFLIVEQFLGFNILSGFTIPTPF